MYHNLNCLKNIYLIGCNNLQLVKNLNIYNAYDLDKCVKKTKKL